MGVHPRARGKHVLAGAADGASRFRPRMCGARRPGIATIIRLGEMVDVETLRDLWESDLARAGWDGRDADEWDQAPIPIIRSAPETTWIWSDLHLGDPSVISVFGRPFTEVGAMNAFLLGEWRDRVQAGHTIICLGDVLHEDVWRNESLMNEIRSCPGDRVLVLGNHDGNARGLRRLGFTVQHTLALCATAPPLALSHEPLRQIPARRDLRARPPARGNGADRAAHQPDRRADPVPAGTARPGRRAGPRARVDHQQQPTMKMEQGRCGRRRARGRDESRLEGDYRALARLHSESDALISPGSGPGPGRATLSSLAGLTSLWRNASSSRLRARRQQCRVRLRFPVYLAYFFESCWCTGPQMFTQPGGSPSRLPTPFPSMPASCAAFDSRGRAPTMSVAAGCASVTGPPAAAAA